MDTLLDSLKSQIPLLHSATRIERIFKGYSTDHKYLLYLQDDTKLVLRTANIDQFERKKLEYNSLEVMKMHHVQCSNPVDVGYLRDLGICYYIVSYIEGEDAKDLLPTYSKEEQYQIGLTAGRDLARISSYPAPSYITPWHERVNKKYTSYLESYKTCGVKLKNEDKIIEFIEKNKGLMTNRPNQFQHDDFHVGNIIVKDKRYAGIIDFNRCDWGDPIHEFVKVALFSKEVSVPFSVGQIKGYYNGDIPENFWTLYSIYVAMTIISSVVWTLKAIPDQLDEMIERLYSVLEDHKYFDQLEPHWFKQYR